MSELTTYQELTRELHKREYLIGELMKEAALLEKDCILISAARDAIAKGVVPIPVVHAEPKFIDPRYAPGKPRLADAIMELLPPGDFTVTALRRAVETKYGPCWTSETWKTVLCNLAKAGRLENISYGMYRRQMMLDNRLVALNGKG